MTNTSSHVKTWGLSPSFGFGDRIGLATPGHVAAMQRSGQGIQPIFPQQSIREMTRTGRTASQVMQDALAGMSAAGWTGGTGADADHLKTTADIDTTHAAGFRFYTLDPSDAVDPDADEAPADQVRAKYERLAAELPWATEYTGRSCTLPNGTRLLFDEESCQRAAVKYGRAIQHALALADHLKAIHPSPADPYEIELSVDETAHPTTLVEHYIVADQCLRNGMPLISLAPRFPGDFEKGVDFKGDPALLYQALNDHAAIAERLGPYKLSLHSGSDKLSVYRALAAATRGRFHVKTAGTSYLEALRVVAYHDEALLRRIITFSRERFTMDRATYHLSATLDSVPPTAEISDRNGLEVLYLERWEDVPAGQGFTQLGRQILHCTFGSVLTHAEFGPVLRQVLREHATTYRDVLTEHFGRHLAALQEGMEDGC